ncbi:porin [Hydrogenimonas sp.]
MKLTKLSLAAIMSLGFTSAAMADVDLQIGGQAVLYYQTLDVDGSNNDLFDQASARGNAGLQISTKADIGDGFQAGLTTNVIGTMGLENNLVAGVMQHAEGGTNNDLDGFWIPEAYVAKTIDNTTVKIGRQYLNTPFAFSEGWNVFKNSFEAAVVVNKDIPDTTLVLAMVNKGNLNGVASDMSNFVSLANENAGQDGGVYTLGLLNNSIENLNVNFWAYSVSSTMTALWLDGSYKMDAGGFGLTLAAQGASINPDDSIGNDDTTMYGLKAATNVEGWGLSAAYNDVNDGNIGMQELGGIKTKLFVQQILNQGSIARDASTFQLKAVTPSFSGAKVIAQYAMTSDDSAAKNDLNEFDLIVKGKALGTNVLLAYVNQNYDNTADKQLVRVVLRKKF